MPLIDSDDIDPKRHLNKSKLRLNAFKHDKFIFIIF